MLVISMVAVAILLLQKTPKSETKPIPPVVLAAVAKVPWDSEYIHCQVCMQGAILPNKDGSLHCTYCGKVNKKDIAKL